MERDHNHPYRPGAMRLLAALLLLLLVPAATAYSQDELPSGPTWYEDPRVGAEWTEEYFTQADGTVLHADVLRPKGLPKDAKTPVLLTIGPYFAHAGGFGATGALDGDPALPVGKEAYPSEIWTDLFVYGQLVQRGYTFAFVDSRGTGGSTGCLDFTGPGEQADVVEAVKWAANAPWSTGKVGIYGKSYLGVTGLVGEVLEPEGLEAIVSMEPVYDQYEYLYANGVRFVNSLVTPLLYYDIAATPGIATGDSLQYQLNALNDLQRPGCPIQGYLEQAGNSDKSTPFWQARDLVKKAPGHDIPLFLTQGFLEDNTKPVASTWKFMGALGGRGHRAWYGQFDHVRGGEETSGDHGNLAGFHDEVMRFFDHYVRGVPLADAPVDKDPPIRVQTGDGTWRTETSWPPDDTQMLATALKPGSYDDTGTNSGTGEASLVPAGTVGLGAWTISPPLPHAAHYAGVPRASLQFEAALPNASMSVDVYDIDTDNRALLLSREASLVPADGKVELDLYGQDWKIPAGHRIGIRVGSADAEWWLPAGTQQPVTLKSGTVTLPFLRHTRTEATRLKRPTRLDTWLKDAPITVPQETVDGATSTTFALPPAQTPRPSAAPPVPNVAPTTGTKARLTARIAAATRRKGSRIRRLTVLGNAPAGARVTVNLQRGGRTVLTRRATAKVGAYRVTFTVRRAGRYAARVSAKRGALRLKASTRRLRVR